MSTTVGQEALQQSHTKVQTSWWPPVEVMGMRSKVKKRAEKDALRVLKRSFRDSIAIEPVGIAERLGVQVREAKFDENILGALFLKPGADPKIVLNRRHSFLRRRLTCALEIGHYVHMSTKSNEYKRVDLYDRSDEVGGESDDEYAHEFAGSLLMPREDIKVFVDLWIDDLEMALRFHVPREAMRIRLKDLGLRVPELGAA
jgi:Zn-dependent peptidase ImmA (M78 family)